MTVCRLATGRARSPRSCQAALFVVFKQEWRSGEDQVATPVLTTGTVDSGHPSRIRAGQVRAPKGGRPAASDCVMSGGARDQRSF